MSSPAAAEAYAAKFRKSGRGAKGEPRVISVPGIGERRNLHSRPLRRPPLLLRGKIVAIFLKCNVPSLGQFPVNVGERALGTGLKHVALSVSSSSYCSSFGTTF